MKRLPPGNSVQLYRENRDRSSTEMESFVTSLFSRNASTTQKRVEKSLHGIARGF